MQKNEAARGGISGKGTLKREFELVIMVEVLIDPDRAISLDGAWIIVSRAMHSYTLANDAASAVSTRQSVEALTIR